MSITDELREWAYSTFAHTIFSNLEKKVDEIADRIDAEHRAALEKVAAMVDWDEGYADSIIAANSLEKRVERIERLLSHKGGAE